MAVNTPPSMPGTRSAPLPSRLGAWLAERHGPVLLIPILLIYGIAVASGALTDGAVPLRTIDVVLGGVGAWLWFLALRVIDDLGDLEADTVAHPDRLLQQGVVTPGELRGLAVASIALQAAICLFADGGIGPVTITWLVAVLVTGVVSSDAAAPAALRSRPLLHRLLRVPCSALPVLWWAQLGSGGQGLTASAAVLALVAVLMVVVFDIARKLEPAGEGQTSWSDSLGERRALTVLAATLAALGAACAGLIAACGTGAAIPFAVIAVVVLVGGASILQSAGKTAPLALLGLLLTTLITLVVAL